jgi:hypothetical protein
LIVSAAAPRFTWSISYGSQEFRDGYCKFLSVTLSSCHFHTADQEIDKTPFLGAENGLGLPFMYRRRPVLSPDDVASMLPV